MKKNVVISVPSMWSVRNFIYAEFRERIEERFNVFYLVPEVENLQKFFHPFGERVIFYPIQKFSGLEDILYIALKYKSLSITSLENNHAFFKSYLKPPNVLRAKLKDFAGLVVSKVLSIPKIEKLLLAFSATQELSELKHKILEVNPQFVLATNHIVKYEIKIFSFLQQQEINTQLYVNSFDNLTSRGILPLCYFRHYYVWNDKMASELQEYYKIPQSLISKVSTPQFDLLAQGAKESLDPMDDLFSLVEHGEFLLYSTGHFSLLPEEPKIVEKFIECLFADEELRKFKIAIRPHPMERYDRWKYLSEKYPNVFIDYPWIQDPQNPNWAVPSVYEFKRLGRILQKARINFNIASTVTLDCCIVDRPIINLYFSVTTDDEKVVRDYYHLDHYKDITQSNCAPRVENETQLLSYTRLLLDLPNKYSEQRRQVREQICNYSANQSASDKLLNVLQNFG